MIRQTGVLAVVLCAMTLHAHGQQRAKVLTLEEAQQIGLGNRPVLRARQFSADAARQTTIQFEAARYPQLSGNVTAATATSETTTQDGQEVTLAARIAAGGLTNPSVRPRGAAGVAVSQLIADFGRTSNLVESSKFNETSQQHQVSATRAQVLIDIDSAYFSVLEAQAILQVATKTVDARAILLDRIAALTRNKLKSELDVRFAQVSLGESRLLLLKAQNAVEAAFAHLSTSLGYRDTRRFELVDQADSMAPPGDLDSLLAQAIAARPELSSLRADREAARKLADAQQALKYPTINAYAAAGVVPIGDETFFPRNYGAIGINLNLTLFDGGKISALQQEAKLRQLALSENLTEAENNVAHAVRVSWLNAKAAYENIEITQNLRDVSSQALKLAESRYNLGITSIVELNQAQLSAIDAEIAYSRAKYQYLIARAALAYQIGALDAAPAR